MNDDDLDEDELLLGDDESEEDILSMGFHEEGEEPETDF